MTRGGPVKRAASPPLERVLVLLDAQPVQGDVGGLLLPDVLRDRRLVQPDGGHVVALRPELPVAELVLEVGVPVEHHQRALPLQVAHEARHRDLGRDAHQHVHVVGHQVPLYDLDALPLAELPEDLPQVPSVLVVDGLPSILRCEHDVVLAEPLRVREAVRPLRHGYHLPLGAGDLNNHHPRGAGGQSRSGTWPPPAQRVVFYAALARGTD